MRVLIVYNEPVLPVDHTDYESEREILDTVDCVGRNLGQAGFAVNRLGVSRDANVLLKGLKRLSPDVVFNLFEGVADRTATETFAVGLLEWQEIPFTGSGVQATCLGRNKALAKYVFEGAGIPTPKFQVMDKLPVPCCSLEWPLIVKPASQDASVGLDQGSVVTCSRQLNIRVARILRDYGPPVLVEEFVAGRELNVAMIEAPEMRMLPISEVRFLSKKSSHWPIVSYEAKWHLGSHADKMTPIQCPAKISPGLANRLQEISFKAFRLLGCQDYARADFRVSPGGRPYLLEVNPNPDLHPCAGFTNGLIAAGLTHAEFCVTLIKQALARGKAIIKQTNDRSKRQAVI